MAAAQADVRHSKAQRYPRIFLNGSIGNAGIESDGHRDDGTVWSVGYRAGSLFELEEARRTFLEAQIAVIQLDSERVSAWISLYRAIAGGW